MRGGRGREYLDFLTFFGSNPIGFNHPRMKDPEFVQVLNRVAQLKPALSDLRESGSIEQDADMVVLLHREAAYERDSPRAGEADLIVAKHRNGPTDTITVAFQGHFSRFTDMAPGDFG